MRLRRIAVLSILLTVLGGAAASAQPVPPGMRYYRWLGCADSTGEIIGLHRVPPEVTYNLRHTIAPCMPPSENSAYAIAFYHADGTAHGLPRPMPSTAATHLVEGLSVAADVVAICLITQNDHRIACAAVVHSAGEASLGPPIPVDAPAVAVGATVPMAMVGVDPPVCPSCW